MKSPPKAEKSPLRNVRTSNQHLRLTLDRANINENKLKEARSNTITIGDYRQNPFMGGINAGGDAPPEDDAESKFFLKKSPR